ncbi:MAG: helix-turn-helix transcriptional regulator [Lachnospiraceae bacterium]|nr:helix-turn-helix transcriptional regulator [Lachnospiraceae bacterium]
MNFKSDIVLYQTIGSNVKHYRAKAGLTQMQLAEKLQISISYLSKIEASGCVKSLSISVLNHIANTLHVDIKDFFNKQGE